jgi:protocatechuate 3,4-dioxygenase beta subunit
MRGWLRKRFGAVILGGLWPVLTVPPVVADTASFREGVGGYSATQDTYVDAGAPSTSYGLSGTVRTDNNGPIQALIRFESIFGSGPGQVPWGATINSAALTVEVSDQAATPANVALHRLLVGWSEASTWNTLVGGISTDDVEALAAADDSVPDPNSIGPETIPDLAPSVQAWAYEAANHGWVIIPDQNNDWGFRSSESGVPPLRPLLTIDYTPASWFRGRVYEDADFSGTAAAWDGGSNDVPLAGVDVELYTSADGYLASTTTDVNGVFTFWSVADGDYKVRVRSGTIGDSNTPPAGGFNAVCGVTDPATGPACVLPELVWARTAALYGGQNPTADDTDTADDAGPGDTWIAVTAAGVGITDLDFGFAYNAIVNTEDSGQGSLRQFLANAEAIGAAGGTTANASEFRMQVAANQSSGGDSWWRIVPASALPPLTDDGTTLDASSQRTNSGSDSNSRGPEIEIHGNGLAAAGLEIDSSSDHVVREIVVNGFAGDGVRITGGGADRNAVHACYVGTNAVGDGAVANTTGIALSAGADGAIGTSAAADRNLVSGNSGEGILVTGSVRDLTILGNFVGVGRTGAETTLGHREPLDGRDRRNGRRQRDRAQRRRRRRQPGVRGR